MKNLSGKPRTRAIKVSVSGEGFLIPFSKDDIAWREISRTRANSAIVKPLASRASVNLAGLIARSVLFGDITVTLILNSVLFVALRVF